MNHTPLPRLLRTFGRLSPIALFASGVLGQATIYTNEATFLSQLTQSQTQTFDSFAHLSQIPLQLPGLEILGNQPSIWNEQANPSGGAFTSAPNVLLNDIPQPIIFSFNPPVDGAGFFNTSIADGETADFFACDGTLLGTHYLAPGTVNFVGLVASTPIAICRVTPAAPTNNTIFIDDLSYGFTGAPGSCSPYTVGGPVCTVDNGSGVNPLDHSCLTLPVIGTTWTTSVTTNPATLLAGVLYSFSGLLPAPVSCPSVTTLCVGGEILVAGPILAEFNTTGTFDVVVPMAVQLLGLSLATQGVRLESSVILTNALVSQFGI